MSLHQLNIQQLRVLGGMLDDRSPTRVAERLGVTQPAVSAALRQLREYFGDALFIRSGNRMLPTPFAASLEEPLKTLLHHGERVAGMRPPSDLVRYRRLVRIAVSEFICSVLVAPLLRTLNSVAPLVTFEIGSILNSRHHYHEDLDQGMVDLIVLPEPYASPNHPFEYLLEEKYVCIVWDEHPTITDTMTVDQFIASRHVSVTNRTVAGQPFDDMHFARMGIARTVEIAVPNVLLVPELILGTTRIATVHESLALKLAQRWPIRVVPCPIAIPPLVEVVQWHTHGTADLAISWLRQGLRSIAEERITAC